MLKKITNKIVNSIWFNLRLDNAYENIFRSLSKTYYNNDENIMLSDCTLGHLSLHNFNILNSYDKLIASIIEKNIFKKYDINTNVNYISFKLVTQDDYFGSLSYMPDLKFDKHSFIKDFLKEFKHVKLDFTDFGIFYSLENFDSDEKKLEAINLIEQAKKLSSCIEEDLDSIFTILIKNI